jgi:hypothetical protein
VAATGVVLARNERRRRAYTPDEIRSRLHERYAQAQAQEAADDVTPSLGANPADGAGTDAEAGHRRWTWGRVLRGGRGSRA